MSQIATSSICSPTKARMKAIPEGAMRYATELREAMMFAATPEVPVSARCKSRHLCFTRR